MGKRFKGKICVYCGLEGTTADHVFAKNFLPPDKRANLPQVSACAACNGAKAQLEHYLLSVLPFGATHETSSDLLEEMVPKRLVKNRKLHQSLSEGRRPITLRTGDNEQPSLSLPFEGEVLLTLLGYVARGLAAYHWGCRIPATYFARGSLLSEFGDAQYRELFVLRSRAEARRDLGGGLILYQGVQAIDDRYMSLWRFRLYGGVQFCDARTPGRASSQLWAATARSPLIGFTEDDAAASP